MSVDVKLTKSAVPIFFPSFLKEVASPEAGPSVPGESAITGGPQATGQYFITYSRPLESNSLQVGTMFDNEHKCVNFDSAPESENLASESLSAYDSLGPG